MTQQYHSWGYTQKNAIQVTLEAPAHPCYKCGIYTQWNFMQA
jgi:hypothetical protein